MNNDQLIKLLSIITYFKVETGDRILSDKYVEDIVFKIISALINIK
jgi:hypothetical protein